MFFFCMEKLLSTDERVRRETLFFGAPKRTKIDSPRKQNKRLAQRRGEPSQARPPPGDETRRDERRREGGGPQDRIPAKRQYSKFFSFEFVVLLVYTIL